MTTPQDDAARRPELTFLCCTYNRSADLREMLMSVLTQDAPGIEYEILIVDNNSSDGTRGVAEEFGKRWGSQVRYLFEPRQGRGFALNTGLPEVRGRYYAIADDDLVFPPGFLTTLMTVLREHPGASCVGGKVLPLWQATPPPWLTESHWSALALSDRGHEPVPTNSDSPICLLAGIYRTADVQAVGGYDNALGVSGTRIGGTEDADLFGRLYDAGKHGLYHPDLTVHHKVEPHRITRAYHRRWHTGHGRSYALMRDPSVERSSARILGMPGHLLRSAARDMALWLGGLVRSNRDAAFEAELRLRFFAGYARTRLRETMACKGNDDRPGGDAGRMLT